MSEQTTTTPDLTDRVATCSGGLRCDSTKPSGRNLAFFEYRGEGSRAATETCGTCGMAEGAHGEINKTTGRPGVTSHPFVERGAYDTDSYYCGCAGWD
jgi:hypothetical protein